jgi:hypothetical protein
MTKVTREQFFNYVKELDREEYAEPQTWIDSTQHYLKLWDRHHGKSWFWSWHWSSFFFFFLWLLYRKMPLFAILYYIFLLSVEKIYRYFFGVSFPTRDILHVSEYFTVTSTSAMSVYIVLVLCKVVIPPLVAGPLYFYHAKKTILTRQGGTSWMMLAILVLIEAVFGLWRDLPEPLQWWVELQIVTLFPPIQWHP